MRNDILICRCLYVFLRKRGMTFKLLSYSCLARVFMDPRNKSEDDCSKSMSEDDGYKKNASENDERMCVLEGASRECVSNNDFTLKSSLRGDNRGQAIYKLEKRGLIGRCLDVFLRKRGMTFICCLLSTTAHAECTPVPDCASIGYTETSCETTSLKCPFDISKLYCLPCDSSFKYDCSGDNITGGVGSACNGKYVSCTCSGGREFNNGSCPQSCTVGMIYYSDKSCSNNYDNSKTAIGVVVKENKLIAALTVPDITWSSTFTGYSSSTDAKTDFNGKNNTAVIVAEHPNDTTSNNAAIYCNEYSTAGTSAGDWYLPAAGEVYDYIYRNYSVVKPVWDKAGATLLNNYLWSSSEFSLSDAFSVNFDYGLVGVDYTKDINTSVSCFLSIN